MNVLLISTDKKLLEKESDVQNRMKFYSESVGALKIVLVGAQGEIKYISDKVVVYPCSRLGSLFFKITKNEIDMISAQDPFENGLIGHMLARKYSVPLQLQIHTDFLNPYFRNESLKNKIRVSISKWLLPRADAVRVVSQKIADSIKEEGIVLKREAVVLPAFVDTQKLVDASIKTDLRVKYPQFEKIILIASRLTREKNIELGIRAFVHFVQKYPNAGLVIVGVGPEREKLIRTIKSEGIEDRVIMEGWCNDLSSYYKTADVFLNTSYYEGYGRTLVEARACGCPVVTTDVGVAREIGVEVTTYDPADIAQRIKKVLSE